MKNIFKTVSLPALMLCASSVFANSPQLLVTHNKTDVESNAFIVLRNGTHLPSQHPTKAYSDGRVPWVQVRMACFGNISGNRCSALIKMATNTANPVNLGVVAMDLNTGDITPKLLQANGYTLTVNGPGETTLTKN